MSRFITKGVDVQEDDGSITKDYFIKDRETGLEVHAERQSNGKFKVIFGTETFVGTIKQAKEEFTRHLEGGRSVEVEPGDEDVGAGRGTWDCCHPCAIITELLGVCDHLLDGPDGQRLRRVIDNTLDCWGWADERGGPDYAASRREMDLWIAKESDSGPAGSN